MKPAATTADPAAPGAIGFVRFSGPEPTTNTLDGRSAGTALLGIDALLRFFIAKQGPWPDRLDYRISVRVSDQPWTALVTGVSEVVGVAGAEARLQTALPRAVQALHHLLRLIGHTHLTSEWDTANVLWGQDHTEIGILNHNNEPVFLPLEYFCWYGASMPRLLTRLIELLSISGQWLTVGAPIAGQVQLASLEATDLQPFPSMAPGPPIGGKFPELEDGDQVRLEGRLVRGNASSNSLGLEYAGHVLNCVPESGSVTRFKAALFLRCVVEGTIQRVDLHGRYGSKVRSPTLVVRNIIPVHLDDQLELFGPV